MVSKGAGLDIFWAIQFNRNIWIFRHRWDPLKSWKVYSIFYLFLFLLTSGSSCGHNSAIFGRWYKGHRIELGFWLMGVFWDS